MRTSLTETEKIEQHLQGTIAGEDEFLFQVKLLLDSGFAGKVEWQKKTYSLVRSYGRKQLRQEITEIHNQLFSAPEHRSFREKVFSIFKRK